MHFNEGREDLNEDQHVEICDYRECPENSARIHKRFKTIKINTNAISYRQNVNLYDIERTGSIWNDFTLYRAEQKLPRKSPTIYLSIRKKRFLINEYTVLTWRLTLTRQAKLRLQKFNSAQTRPITVRI